MKNRVSIVLFAIVIFAVGIAVGRMSSTSHSDETTVEVLAGPEKSINPVSGSGKIPAGQIKSSTSASLGEEAGNALAANSSNDRMRKFSEVLAKLDASNWQGVWDVLKAERADGRFHKDKWEQFLMAMGEINGEAAMARLMTEMDVTEKTPPDFHYIMRGWAAKNPQAASAWLGAQPAKKFRDSLYSGYLGGLAEADISKAMTEVQKVPADKRHYFFWDLAPRVFMKGGLELGRQWMDQVVAATDVNNANSLDYTGMVFGEVSGRIIDAAKERKDPKMAFEWMKDHIGQPYFSKSKWEAMAASYVSQSPQEAMQTLSSPEYAAAGTQGLEAGIRQWSQSDIEGAGQWLRTQTASPAYPRLVMSYAKELEKSNPAAAASWLNSLPK